MRVTDGRQLKAARVALGLTVRELAQKAGLNRNSILRVEALKEIPHNAFAVDCVADILRGMGVSFVRDQAQAGILFPASTERKKRRNRKIGTGA